MVIAHRGASGYAPENTLAAFDLAARLGADGVEFDVGLSVDEQPVVIHDRTVDRTTNGSGNVAFLTTHELARFDAGTRFEKNISSKRRANLSPNPAAALDHTRFHCGVPSQEETLALLAETDLARIYIELKGAPSTRSVLLGSSLRIIRRSKAKRRVTLLSFDHELIAAAKTAQPDIRAAVTVHIARGVIPRTRSLAKSASRAGAVEVALHHALATRRRVDALHDLGLAVSAWTANAKSTMRRLIARGVESIMTNYPDRLDGVIDSSVSSY